MKNRMSIKLTNQKISITIKLTLTIFAISNIFAKCTDDQNIPKDSIYPKVSALNFSEQYLLAVKSDQSFIAYQDTLASLNLILLKKELDTFDKGLCFWINMYNATVQSKAKNDTTTFKDRNAFFKDANILIGGAKLSLDNIEHNILRGKKEGENEFTDSFKLNKLDNRLHFALNCGAAACPPVAFYSADKINEQLDLAEEVFIQSVSKFDTISRVLETSKILDWYIDDFGGETGIIDLMKKHGILGSQTISKITYTPYDWTLDLNNY